MPFDLSPWGFVRPAIHCNVVIFKFISKKSLTSSLPELRCLFLFQRKKRERQRESEALAAFKVLACAAGATACCGRLQQSWPDSWGLQSQSCQSLPGTAGWALRTRYGEFLSSPAVESGRVPAPRAKLLQLWGPLQYGRSREHLGNRRPQREKGLQSTVT